jgi:predicted PurR-regulated permease PerM
VESSGLRELFFLRCKTMWNSCCDRLYGLTGRWLLDRSACERFLERFRTGGFSLEAEQVGACILRVFASVLVTFVSTLLILAELEQVKGWLRRLAGRLFHRGFGSTLGHAFCSYLRAQLIILGAVTSICVLGLLLARIHGWLLIGAAIGICDALPFLGTGICFLPWALWRLVNGQYASAAWFVLLYLLSSMTRQLLEPRLIGKGIGVPPLLVLFSVYVGVKIFTRCGFLLGPISAFLIWQLASDRVEKEDAYESDRTGTAGDDQI